MVIFLSKSLRWSLQERRCQASLRLGLRFLSRPQVLGMAHLSEDQWSLSQNVLEIGYCPGIRNSLNRRNKPSYLLLQLIPCEELDLAKLNHAQCGPNEGLVLGSQSISLEKLKRELKDFWPTTQDFILWFNFEWCKYTPDQILLVLVHPQQKWLPSLILYTSCTQEAGNLPQHLKALRDLLFGYLILLWF